ILNANSDQQERITQHRLEIVKVDYFRQARLSTGSLQNCVITMQLISKCKTFVPSGGLFIL
ncbi:unnamed protein product, partial [Schistosoma rodhaini]